MADNVLKRINTQGFSSDTTVNWRGNIYEKRNSTNMQKSEISLKQKIQKTKVVPAMLLGLVPKDVMYPIICCNVNFELYFLYVLAIVIYMALIYLSINYTLSIDELSLHSAFLTSKHPLSRLKLDI